MDDFRWVYSTGHLAVAVLAIAGDVLSSAYALSFVRYAFFGHPKESLQDVKEVPLKILAPMLVLALVAVIVGVYPAPFFEWVTGALGPLHLGI